MKIVTKVEMLKSLLVEAVAKLYANDFALFLVRGLENACVVRVIYYMQEMLNNDPRFREWRHYNLDFEYNKSAVGLKVINARSKYIKPDLILHVRGTDVYNLMVIEFKKGQNTSNNDIEKLRALTGDCCYYRYILGGAVALKKQGPTYNFVENGNLTECYTKEIDIAK